MLPFRHVRGDHPRACGEHKQMLAPHEISEGSSPRLRGTLRTASCIRRRCGIIPALAGNTSVESSKRFPTGDHPRACGEHSMQETVGALSLGSSPRLRGTQPARVHARQSAGIIPALAGNTPALTRSRSPPWDHPRACGEHALFPVRPAPCLGSSPRLRGTHTLPCGRAQHVGIIPALAGNTWSAP